MGRVHLFEFEDQPWCPPAFRRAITGYLRLVIRMTRQVRPVVPELARFLRSTGETRIVDLCSGSGDIALQLADGLEEHGIDARILVTDLYPDRNAMNAAARASGGRIVVHPAPLDATALPDDLPGLRTVFNAFHHFEPDDARRILGSAAASGHPILVAEFLERSLFPLSGVFFSPLLMLVLAPFTGAPLLPTLVFTYLVPVLPLMVFWDALVSWLRVYSMRDLEAMAAASTVPGYRWKAGRWRVGPVRITWLMGCRADGHPH